jgi:E-phenylitaconyl-CoA hydratase
MPILFERRDAVAQITLNRPEVLNAMDRETYREVTDALQEIEKDPEIRVGIITGAGDRAFSSGADIKEMHGPHDVHDVWQPWRPDRWDFGVNTSKPMIAAITGYALAGALELTLLCDIRIAAPHAEFGCPEVKWNLLHGFGALRLPKVVGLSAAMEMLLTGEFIDAERALQIGLISRIVPLEDLLPTAYRIAERICENGPLAVQVTKEIVLRGLDSSLEDGLRFYKAYDAMLNQSEDQREGTRAFAEKRKPRFIGR